MALKMPSGVTVRKGMWLSTFVSRRSTMFSRLFCSFVCSCLSELDRTAIVEECWADSEYGYHCVKVYDETSLYWS